MVIFCNLMTLEQDIKHWDGASIKDLEAIYNRHEDSALFMSEIIKCYKHETLQIGATWLLKRYLENNNRIGVDQTKIIFSNLSLLKPWQAMLNILQCMSFMSIESVTKKDVAFFLRQCLISDNKFVRAWAYNGFYEISIQYPGYEKEVKQFFAMAMKDEAPSVKARIRNIMKSNFN